MQSFSDSHDHSLPKRTVPVASATFKNGGLLEMVYDPELRQSQFVLWRDGEWKFQSSCAAGSQFSLVPYTAHNNLIRNEIVLFPSTPQEYESEEALLAEIRRYIHRYVDLTPSFEVIAACYVLFSWLYDGFNELPYLRVRGDPGSGKTRFLLTVGSLCYKPIFASGASTVSPLFRLLESFRGTLIIDESDFRFSDEKAEMVKILNNGNVRGFPVLRSEASRDGEFNPRAYQVFGPKILASRGDFEDRALESRFITEEMGTSRVRKDVPINLPMDYKAEALALRNKLLLFRFRNFRRRAPVADFVDHTLEPRLNQIFVPLLSVITDPTLREELRSVAQRSQRDIVVERGLDTEAQVLSVLQELMTASPGEALAIGDIAEHFAASHGDEYERKITPKWIGGILRKRLRLRAERRHGVYVIPPAETPKLLRLLERYGLTEPDPPPLAPPLSGGADLVHADPFVTEPATPLGSPHVPQEPFRSTES